MAITAIEVAFIAPINAPPPSSEDTGLISPAYWMEGISVPIMVYNNPPIYKNDVTPDILATLTDCDNIVCFKDSSGDTRRFIDLRNTVGDRFVLFAGLDDVVVESIAVGAEGWISGMSNAFPREGETLFRLARQQRYEEAMALYRWFMPLNDLIGIPYVRLVHLVGMWCFIIFAMIHVYLSILSGNVDRDGTISSMFSGGRWLRKGVKFRDE